MVTQAELAQLEPAMEKLNMKFRVGDFICEMFWRDGGLRCEWLPNVPNAKKFSKKEWKQYRAGRNAWMAELSKIIGGKVAVLEL